MIPFFLSHRLRRIGRRPAADPEARAFVRAALVRAGYLNTPSLWATRLRVTLASFTVFITGIGGMASYAYASDAVLPNTPLYPMRESIERLAIDLAPTPTLQEQALQTRLARRKKEATLLKALNKPLPAVHARILLREELQARKIKRTTSTESVLSVPSVLPRENRREQKKEDRAKERQEDNLIHDERSSVRLFATSTLPLLERKQATSTRSRAKLPKELRLKREILKNDERERSSRR